MAKLVETNRSLEVRKSEVLIKASYKLTPIAMKLISLIISNIKRSDSLDEEYVVKAKEFMELLGEKNYGFYKLIDEAVEVLLSNPIKIALSEKRTLKINWISSGEYSNGEVVVTIDKKLRPYLLELKERFLKHNLEYILNIKSVYAIRMYEILKDSFELNSRYGNKPETIISVDELRKILEIPKGYRYADIKRRVLEKSKEELKKHTDIIFNYEEMKEKRKVTKLKFFIRPNPNKQVNYSIMYNYFKSRRNFVALLRKNYSGNGKFFGYRTIDGKKYWLGLDKNGLLYAVSLPKKDEMKDFNANESLEIYDIWYKIAKGSDLYQFLIESGNCLKELYHSDKSLFDNLSEDIKEIMKND